MGNQTHAAEAVLVQVDWEGVGPAVTRNFLLERVETEWVAFLDDDDVLKPVHLDRLLRHAQRTGADLVYPQYGALPNEARGVQGVDVDALVISPWDATASERLRVSNFIPVTVLVRTSVVREVGGFPEPGDPDALGRSNEDWALWLRLLRLGAQFAHLPERTWIWRDHAGRCGGLSWREHPYVRTTLG